MVMMMSLSNKSGRRVVAACLCRKSNPAGARISNGTAGRPQRCRDFQTDPAQANLIKLLGNMMTATALEVLGEIVTRAAEARTGSQQFVDIMTGTMFDSRVHKNYGSRLIAGSFKPGLPMPLALKDVRLALAEAELAGAPMPSVGVFAIARSPE
jgi:hypothetical protein